MGARRKPTTRKIKKGINIKIASYISGYRSHLELEIAQVSDRLRVADPDERFKLSKILSEFQEEATHVIHYQEKNPEKVRRQLLIDKKRAADSRKARVSAKANSKDIICQNI